MSFLVCAPTDPNVLIHLSIFLARTEKDIRVLQDQIASLQKQLDAVATRRRQMAIDAEEYRRRMEY